MVFYRSSLQVMSAGRVYRLCLQVVSTGCFALGVFPAGCSLQLFCAIVLDLGGGLWPKCVYEMSNSDADVDAFFGNFGKSECACKCLQHEWSVSAGT